MPFQAARSGMKRKVSQSFATIRNDSQRFATFRNNSQSFAKFRKGFSAPFAA